MPGGADAGERHPRPEAQGERDRAESTTHAKAGVKAAASTDAAAARRPGGSRPGRLSRAEPSAPPTNPSWTAPVTQAVEEGVGCHAAVSAGRTAVAETHRVIAMTWAAASSASCTSGVDPGLRDRS